jgi:hypothetical protein
MSTLTCPEAARTDMLVSGRRLRLSRESDRSAVRNAEAFGMRLKRCISDTRVCFCKTTVGEIVPGDIRLPGGFISRGRYPRCSVTRTFGSPVWWCFAKRLCSANRARAPALLILGAIPCVIERDDARSSGFDVLNSHERIGGKRLESLQQQRHRFRERPTCEPTLPQFALGSPHEPV